MHKTPNFSKCFDIPTETDPRKSLDWAKQVSQAHKEGTPINDNDFEQLQHIWAHEALSQHLKEVDFPNFFFEKPLYGLKRGDEIIWVPQSFDAPIQTQIEEAFNLTNTLLIFEFRNKCLSKLQGVTKEELFIDNAEKAISVAARFHQLLAQTITEDWSTSTSSINSKALAKRKKSALQTVIHLASTLERTPLMIFDNIALNTGVNPFYLNKETQEIQLKQEVIKLMCLLGRIFVLAKENPQNYSENEDIGKLASEFDNSIKAYAPQKADEVFKRIDDIIATGLQDPEKKARKCPALQVETPNGSLFISLFNQNIKVLLDLHDFITTQNLPATST